VARSARGSGGPLEAAGNGGPRWMTTARCKPGTGSGLQAGSLLYFLSQSGGFVIKQTRCDNRIGGSRDFST